jgi:hypothetical protein
MKFFAQSVQMRWKKKTRKEITGNWLIHGCTSGEKVSVRAFAVFIQ